MSEITEPTVGSEKSSKKPRKATTKSKTTKTSRATSAKTSSKKAKKPKTTRKKSVDLETFTALQEQIAANQKELLDNISETFQTALNTQLKRADRRRRWNNFFRDLIIVILMLGLGYAGHLLYSLGYRIEGAELVNTNDTQDEEVQNPEPVKDDTWYLANYSYLLDQVKTNLNADSVSAYYLYSNDHDLKDIKPEYLLNMAYHQVEQDRAANAGGSEDQAANDSTKNHLVTVEANTLKTKFAELFGDSVKFYAGNFSAGCLNFVYQRATETFEAENQTCALNQHREVMEEIERIYQEGEVIYVISRAGIYDKDEHSFYNFNDLFRPVAKDVEQTDFSNLKDQLNRYQYQFKKSGEKYYFNKITKLD